MKFLLVNPPAIEKGPVLREECCVGRSELRPPAQMLLSAAYLESLGFDVDVLDAQLLGLSWEQLKKKLHGYDAVVSWVSLIDAFYPDTLVFKLAKEDGAKTIMVMNDPYEDLERKAMENNSNIDCTIRLNERELTLGRVLKIFAEKNPHIELPKLTGIIFRHEDRVVDRGKSKCLKSAEHLVSSSNQLEKLPIENYDNGVVISGKGCPYQCSFCLYRNTWHRSRKPRDVAEEMLAFSTAQDYVYVLDLDMLIDESFSRNLAGELARLGVKIDWMTDARVEQCPEDVLLPLKRAGLNELVLGVESADPQIRKMIRKQIEEEEIERAYQNCLKTGITPNFHLIFGFPWDSEESGAMLERFLDSHPEANISFHILRPLRGTPLYQECLDAGLIKEIGIDRYVRSIDDPLIDHTKLLDVESFEEVRTSIVKNRRFKNLPLIKA